MYVYILQSEKTGKYYCGQSQDLLHRLVRHNHGLEKATKNGTRWKKVHFIEVDSQSKAVRIETKIKKEVLKRFLLDI